MTAPSMPATAQVSHSIDYSSGTRSSGQTRTPAVTHETNIMMMTFMSADPAL
jgi:hypothetical protein